MAWRAGSKSVCSDTSRIVRTTWGSYTRGQRGRNQPRDYELECTESRFTPMRRRLQSRGSLNVVLLAVQPHAWLLLSLIGVS